MVGPDALMPDLSHLTEEERKIIEEVMQRQKTEENKEQKVQRQYEKELEDIERQINERKQSANKLVGTQDDAICQICQKTKFADGVGNKCYYCQLRSCARCGGRMPIKTKGDTKPSVFGSLQNSQAQQAQQNKVVWACALCQKRQQIVVKTGRWFNKDTCRPTTPTGQSPSTVSTPTSSGQPFSIIASIFGSSSSEQQQQQQPPSATPSRPPSQQSGAVNQPSARPANSSTDSPVASGAKPQPAQRVSAAPQQQQRQQHPDSIQRRVSIDKPVVKERSYPAQPDSRHLSNNQQQQQQQQQTPSTANNLQQDKVQYTKRESKRVESPVNNNKNMESSPAYGNGRVQTIKENVPYEKDADARNYADAGRRSSAARRQYERSMSNEQVMPVDDSASRKSSLPRHNSSSAADKCRTRSPQQLQQQPQQTQTVAPPSNHARRSSREERHAAATNQQHHQPQQEQQLQNNNNTDNNSNQRHSKTNNAQGRNSTSPSFRSSRPKSFDDHYPEDNSYFQDEESLHHPKRPPSAGGGDARRPSSKTGTVAQEVDKHKQTLSSASNAKSRSAERHHTAVIAENAAVGYTNNVANKQNQENQQQQQQQRHHYHHHHHHHHNQQGKQAGGGKQISGVATASRQHQHSEHRSKRVPYSSSEDEMPSTSECQSCDDFESGSTSDRGDIEKRLSASKYDDLMIAQCMNPTVQIPVTWQTSHDGSRVIGHLVLHRQASVSLGLKVVGGRPTHTGRLGAFITRVKRGSIADSVGHLKSGDEVLEWNGRSLQDISFDEVCEIINESKHEPHIELIVSRPVGAVSTTQTSPSQLLKNKNVYIGGSQLSLLGSTTNLMPSVDSSSQLIDIGVGTPLIASMAHIPTLLNHQDKTPIVMIATPTYHHQHHHHHRQSALNVTPASLALPKATGQIFGKVQVSLYYHGSEQNLTVCIHQAMDLPTRNDRTGRNPYAKMFLLPDRNEESRRQSNTIANTCHPVWQQKFIYKRLAPTQLVNRVVEITVWDYDQYESNEFLGEVLIELTPRLLDNEPRWYTLTDMDEESPARTKLRQQRMSSHNQDSTCNAFLGYNHIVPQYDSRIRGDYHPRPHSCNSGYRSDSGIFEEYLKSIPPRPRTSHRLRNSDRELFDENHEQLIEELTVTDKGSYGGGAGRYIPRHASRPLTSRLPRAVGASTSTSTTMASANDEYLGTLHQRNLPKIPSDLYGEEAMRELDEKVQQLRNHGHTSMTTMAAITGRRQQPPTVTSSSGGQTQILMSTSAPTSTSRQRHHRRQPELTGVGVPLPGYQSDESETSMSVTSAHSEKPSMKTVQEFQNRLEAALEEAEPYGAGQNALMSDAPTMVPVSGHTADKGQTAFAMEANRKKSLMNRFIPGKGGGQLSAHDVRKRLGFPRSEEVGVPYGMSPPKGCYQPQLLQQSSFESVGSGVSSESSWMPVIPPECTLGQFVSHLGPGQVVGRQVVASPCLGELQLVLSGKGNNLEVKVVRARNLVKKLGAKYNPAPYIKVYLMDGKHCVAKAKTSVAARTAEPRFDQHLIFTEPYRGRFLQISAWGDYGRMERKVFMGIALVKLDSLDFSLPNEGWYKLYNMNSLAGTNSPVRKGNEIGAMTEPSGNGTLPSGQMRT